MDLRSAPIRTLSLADSKSYIVATLRFCARGVSARPRSPCSPGRRRKIQACPEPGCEDSRHRTSGIFFACTRRISSRPRTSGRGDDHAAVKAAGTQQRGIEHIGTVGSGHQDHAFVRLEAVHFHQQLVQRLLALVVPAAQAGAAMTAHRVDFVDEDDAGRILLALLEQVADPAGAHADKHLHKVRAGDAEERHIRLAGTARASRVLPVPGGPTSSTPLGMRPPSFWNFWASRRNSMISRSSSLASSTPATSLNVTFFCCMESRRARLLPNDRALLPPVCICRIMMNHNAASRQ